MLGTPDIFVTLVFDGVTFLGHLPLRATSLGRLLPILCFATTLLLGRAGIGFTLERDFFCKRAILHLHIVDHSSESHNLGVFLICVDPRAIRHHIECILSNFVMISEGREMSSMIQELLS